MAPRCSCAKHRAPLTLHDEEPPIPPDSPAPDSEQPDTGLPADAELPPGRAEGSFDEAQIRSDPDDGPEGEAPDTEWPEEESAAEWLAHGPDVEDHDAEEAVEVVSGFGAPPVVAVVVTKDPGARFVETVASLEAQDYPQLEVLVVDNGGSIDPAPIVADVSPHAFVKRIEADEGFSAAVNEAAASVKGAPFLLVCHDDVKLAPDAVTQLVAEAFRSNAGVVGPKLLDWDRPDELRSVGVAVDRFGAPRELVDPGELDQSQHDISRPVFAVSDACMLVRADLFDTIGGFSDAIGFFGEDVDLCWKAHLAGAAVQFCHRAAVGHRGDFESRRPVDARDRLELRHQARMTLANHSGGALVRVIPAAFITSLVELVATVIIGRGRTAVDILATWLWVLVHPLQIHKARRRRKPFRRSREADWAKLQRSGSNRMRALFGERTTENRVVAATRAGRAKLRDATSIDTQSSVAVAVAVVVPLLLAFGARSLWFGVLPSMREFTSMGDSVGSLFSEWFTGWRASGLGEPAVPPGAIGGLGALGTVLLFSAGAARRVLLLAPLILGPVGAWRLLPRGTSMRARSAALAVYGLSPIILNAVGEARLQALVAYAAAPWLLRRIARHAGLEPIPAEGHRAAPRWRHWAGTSLMIGIVAAVSPLAAVVVVVAAIAVVIGPGLAGQASRASIAIGGAAVGLVGAALLNLPWLLAAVRSGDAATLTGLWEGRAPVPSAADMLTGSIGPVQMGVFGWGLVAAAAVPLFTGKKWRLGWAAGGWIAIVAGLGAAVLAGRSDLLAGAGVEVFLVPVALGMAVSIAMAPLAFEQDVVRADFGMRQVLSFLGVGALVLGLLPQLVAVTQGRWYLADGDFERALSVVDSGDDYRTLWIGDPDVLPLSGWALDSVPGVNIGMSEGLDPVMSQRWRLDGGSSVEAVAKALTDALEGRTARLGRGISPMAIRYVIVVDRPAPEPFAASEVPMPRGVVDALEEQLDLRRILVGPGVDLFEINAAWPPRSDITEAPEPGEAPPAVLGEGFGTAFSGDVPDNSTVAQAVTGDPGWSLSTPAGKAERDKLFDWGQKFAVDGGGEASLRWSPPISTRGLQALQLLLLVGFVWVASRRNSLPTPTRRRTVARPDEPIVVLDGSSSLDDWASAEDQPGDEQEEGS